MPHPRRCGRWIVLSGICLSLLSAVCVGMWFWLPYFAPNWVIRHSPWLEPVVRTRMYHAWAFIGSFDNFIQNPDPDLYQDRIDSWGPTLLRDLAPLLHSTPGMRAAALETYPLQVPLTSRPGYIVEPKDWERIVVNVQPIFDEDRVWFRARVNNTDYELGNPQVDGIGGVQATFDRARAQADSTAHPYLPDHVILKISLELRIDARVPFWLVDRLISAANEHGRKPGEQDFAVFDATASYGAGRHADGVLRTTLLPTPPAAHVITLVPHATSGADAGVDVLVDEAAVEHVDGAVNSQVRHDGVVRAIARGLPTGAERRNAICVRGGPLTPWGDVVAGLDGAGIALDMKGAASRSGGAGDPSTRRSLTIAPVFTGK